MSRSDQDALQFCASGLEQMWNGATDAAIETYDRALTVAESDEVRELVAIRKAEALIAAEREGAEIAQLPAIILRRRSPRHVYHAASALMRKFADLQEDRKRALFYGQIARDAAAELGDSYARAHVLNGLGVILVADSQFEAGAESFQEALEVVSGSDDERLRELHIGITANLGGTLILLGSAKDGIRMIESVLRNLTVAQERAEAMLDLVIGYMSLDQYSVAESFARYALELAASRRHIRNANHLMGEICVRTGRDDEADQYFDVVASFYPGFKNVKQLLVAVDLCSVVNWKA